jgi:hypothetical protein
MGLEVTFATRRTTVHHTPSAGVTSLAAASSGYIRNTA